MMPTMPELGLAAGLVAGALVLLTAVLARRRAARSRRQLEERLAESQREVAELARAVAGLSRAVETSRRAATAERAHVITTLAEAADAAELGAARQPLAEPAIRPVTGAAVAEVLEEQVVSRLADVDTTRPWGARLAGAGVKALALGHGVRRALSEENRDRAAAEAHVARRRSRRTRRQELREARRLLRALRSQQAQQQPGVRTAEDAA